MVGRLGPDLKRREAKDGSAYGIRTRVTGVRGRRPRPLDECAPMKVGSVKKSRSRRFPAQGTDIILRGLRGRKASVPIFLVAFWGLRARLAAIPRARLSVSR